VQYNSKYCLFTQVPFHTFWFYLDLYQSLQLIWKPQTTHTNTFSCFLSCPLQFAPSSPKVCTPSSACMTGRRSTCSCPSAGRCTSALSRHLSLLRQPTSLSSSWGLSSRTLWWELSSTMDGPSSSTCTVLTQVGNPITLYSVSPHTAWLSFTLQKNVTVKLARALWVCVHFVP